MSNKKLTAGFWDRQKKRWVAEVPKISGLDGYGLSAGAWDNQKKQWENDTPGMRLFGRDLTGEKLTQKFNKAFDTLKESVGGADPERRFAEDNERGKATDALDYAVRTNPTGSLAEWQKEAKRVKTLGWFKTD